MEVQQGSFSCAICKTFKAPNFRLLMSHIRLVHATKPGFQMRCNIDSCSRNFTNMKTYDNHLSTSHFMYSRTIMPDGTNTADSIPDGAGTEGGHYEDANSDNGQANDANLVSSGPGSGAASDTTVPQETQTLEELKSAAALWILKIKETCKLTQSATDEIIQGATDFNNYILSKLHGVVKNALEELHIDMNNVPQLAKAFNADSPFLRPFQGIETHHLHMKYCKENLGLVVSVHLC